MGRLEFTTPRDAWGGEASAFTPLLADDEMLEYLGQSTGIGSLALIESEHSTAGKRSLDILAERPDGSRVAIENQYNTADHDHLTRGLAYAVATESRALVVIAEGHRGEFVSVAEYLNDVAVGSGDKGIEVWLVEVRAVRRKGDDVWSAEFVVRAQPNRWEASVRRNLNPKLASLEDFYNKCESSEWASLAKRIIEDWMRNEGAQTNHNAQSTVALYHPTPRNRSKGLAVVKLGIDGGIVICRGHLKESSGAFESESAIAELDEAIGRFCPAAGREGLLRRCRRGPRRHRRASRLACEPPQCGVEHLTVRGHPVSRCGPAGPPQRCSLSHGVH